MVLKTRKQTRTDRLRKGLTLSLLLGVASWAQTPSFHNAPASAKTEKNPYQGQQTASGKSAFQLRCAACHGANGEGSGNIPSLASEKAQGASDGELFWYITKGDVNNGMPSWESLPEEQRWQIVNYLRVLGASKPGSPRVRLSSDEAVHVGMNAPPPKTPFTDYRFEKPGTLRKITLGDLPAPLSTTSAGNSPQLVARPEKAWPQVPAGFQVELYTTGLDQPRLIRTAPNGDFFVAESKTGEVRVFRGITAEGKPEQAATFATGLKRPFGINFYPPGLGTAGRGHGPLSTTNPVMKSSINSYPTLGTYSTTSQPSTAI
jgi:mono/diheme cytochrome c family protein